jgi:hypothetical protein
MKSEVILFLLETKPGNRTGTIWSFITFSSSRSEFGLEKTGKDLEERIWDRRRLNLNKHVLAGAGI